MRSEEPSQIASADLRDAGNAREQIAFIGGQRAFRLAEMIHKGTREFGTVKHGQVRAISRERRHKVRRVARQRGAATVSAQVARG